MMGKAIENQGQEGFTLLEIIITLIVAALLGTMLIQFMGTGMIRSADSVVLVQEGFSLNQVMEKMTADYKKLLAEDSTPLQTFKSHVENGNVVSNDPCFGEYSWQTAYIKFSGGSEVADIAGDNRILKVTISHGNQSLAALYTK